MRPALALAAILAAGGLAACERHVAAEPDGLGETRKETEAVSVDEDAVRSASEKVASEVTAAGTAIVAGVKDGVKEGRAEARADLADGDDRTGRGGEESARER